MIEIASQIRDSCPICKGNFGIYYLPYSDEDREKSKAHKLFQIVKQKITGVRKQRVLKQMNLYWACCKYIADNTDHKQWNTKEGVDFQCRVRLHFVDSKLLVIRANGEVVFYYKSIAMKNLPHIEACNYFNQAFENMANFQGISVEKLIENTKANMLSY